MRQRFGDFLKNGLKGGDEPVDLKRERRVKQAAFAVGQITKRTIADLVAYCRATRSNFAPEMQMEVDLIQGACMGALWMAAVAARPGDAARMKALAGSIFRQIAAGPVLDDADGNPVVPEAVSNLEAEVLEPVLLPRETPTPADALDITPQIHKEEP